MALPPPVLMHLGTGSNVQVYRVIAGSSAFQLGNNVSAASPYTADPDHYVPGNTVCLWEDEIWLWHGDDVYKYNSGTNNWDAQSLALAIQNLDGYRPHSGLYEIKTASGPRLIGVYSGTATNEMRYISYDGSSWSDGTFGVVGYNPVGMKLGIIYRDVLFWNVPNEVGLWAFDLSGPTQTQYSFATVELPYAMCVWNNELWCLAGKTNGYGGTSLYKFTGSGFTEQKSAVGAAYNGATGSIRTESDATAALHVDPSTNALVAVFPGLDTVSGNEGIFAMSYDYSTLTETDRTSTIVPTSIRANGTGDAQDRIVCFADNSTPGTVSIHYYFQPRQPGPLTGSWTSYTFEGLSTLFTNNGGGLSADFVFPQEPEGGGSRVWTSGQPWVHILGTAKALGAETITFLAGSSGTKEVEFRYSDKEESPADLATLKASTATGGSATNTVAKVQNVTANGTTQYTVDRDVDADGLTIGSREGLMPVIDTTL